MDGGDKKMIKLLKPVIKGKISLEETINLRHSIRKYKDKKLMVIDISQLLWGAAGKKVDMVSGASRTYPSAGACYPLEFYLVAGEVEGISPGVYHYLQEKHALKMVLEGDLREKLTLASYGQSMIKYGPATIVITAVYSRTTEPYGKRGERYVHMDSGHSGENIYLMATARGLGTVAVGAFDDAEVKKVLRLPENEEPLYLFPVGHPMKSEK